MRRHSAKPLYRRPFWNLGGTLNELDSPSELPEGDVLECVNWRVHKDSKSREKRPGYAPYDVNFSPPPEPIIQIHEYLDPNNFKRKVVVTTKKIMMQKEVVGYSNKYTSNQLEPFKVFLIYENKLVALEMDASNNIKAITSADGATWTTLFTSTYAYNGYSCPNAIIFNNHIFFTRYDSVAANPKVVEWNGTSFMDHLTGVTDYYAYSLFVFDGKLWCITDSCGSADFARIVRYYNGVSWSAITNYDGSASLNYNTAYNPQCDIKHRTSRFFVFNNDLYFLASYYNSTSSKWTWQVWKFKTSTYDQFNKIYETNDDYALSAVIEYKGKVYIIANGLAANGNGTKSARLYSSSDMVNWKVEGSFATLGFPYDEFIYDGRIYINCLDINDTGYTEIYYFDRLAKNFVLEQSITTNADANECGGLINFLGDLYLGKFKEIYKRTISSNQWQDIKYFTQEIRDPPPKAVYEERLNVGGSLFGSNTMIEGDTVYQLGINAPTSAPSVADSGVAGNPSGIYKYVVTFYRSGNYPCESNPSPESAEVTVSSKKIDLSNIPISSDPKVNARRIYRTVAGGAIFYWLADINDNSTTTYQDDISDDGLGDEVSYDRGVPPQGKFFEVWDNRLWIAGNNEHPSFLFFTNLGTSEEMATNNFLNIKRRESDVIMQIKAFGDYLYVWKKKSWFRIEKVGDSLYEVIQMPQKIGTDASYSVAVCDKLLIWKSEYGIEVFNGVTNFRPIPSEKIQRTMDSINKEMLNLCIGGHNAVDGEYWLTIPTGTGQAQDKVIVLDYLKKIFTIYEFAEGVSSLVTVSEAIGENLVNLIGTSDGNLYLYGQAYTDNGTLINAHFKTGWINVTGERAVWNILRRMFIKYILPSNKTITMKIYRNFKKDAVATIGLAGFTPTTIPELRNEIMRRINLGIRAYYVLFEFINNEDVGGDCRVVGWDSYFKKRIWKRTLKGD